MSLLGVVPGLGHEQGGIHGCDAVDGGRRQTADVAGGVLLALLGLLAIAFPLVTGISLALLFGATLIVGGVLSTPALASA